MGEGAAGYELLKPRARRVGHLEAYRARDRASGREVELRLLVDPGDAARELFDLETAELYTLEHAGFPQLLKVGRLDGLPYYTVPWVELPTLAGLLEDPGFGLDARVAAVRGLGAALSAAHRTGILLGRLRAGLVGWDAARAGVLLEHVRAPAEAGEEPPAGLVPPDLAGGAARDPKGDLFLWGALAYRLLARGADPFPDGRTLVPIRRRSPSVVAGLAHALEACLSLDPARRPPSGAELGAVLEALPAGLLPQPPVSLVDSGTVPADRIRGVIDDLRKQGKVPPPLARKVPSRSMAVPAAGGQASRARRLAVTGAALGMLAAGAWWLAPPLPGPGGAGPAEHADPGRAGREPARPGAPGAGPGAPGAGPGGGGAGGAALGGPGGGRGAASDAYVGLLLGAHRVTPADFLRRWRIALYLVEQGRLKVAGCDAARLEALHQKYGEDPEGACKGLQALLDEVRDSVVAPAAGS